jgi:predicted SAM-dependent methyltransferase
MKLHVGCGTNKLPGWVNIDGVEGCKPDLVHDLSQPLPYEALSADELKAEGVLEHFDKYMRYVVVSDWVRVLKVGGLLHLELPDFDKLLWRFKKFVAFDSFVDTFFGENMYNGEIYISHYGNHKWGYSRKSLTQFLQEFGIEPVSVKTKGLNISYTGRKIKDIPLSEIDQWVIHSHNNKFGASRDRMTVAEAKVKINEFNKNLK